MTRNLGIYIHIPFCEVKCGYCDFFSIPRGWADQELQDTYSSAVRQEMSERAAAAGGRPPVTSVYFGGGTPSLLSPSHLEGILEEISRHFAWEGSEVTLEANPKTVSKEKLAAFRRLGFNRISIGVQSFDDEKLSRLGRIHSGADAVRTVREAREAGFENINLDLIFALPGQGLSEWERDLETGISLQTEHLSAYHLTIEEGTPFFAAHRQGRLSLPDDEVSLRMFCRTRERLGAAGLAPYEISNFARPGFESVHNRNYWRYGEWLGFGAGAVSFQDGLRRSNRRDLKGYLARPADNFDEERPERRIQMGEYCLMGLRQTEGISGGDFEKRFGAVFEETFRAALEEGSRRDWIRRSDGRWKLTRDGVLFSNEILAEFL